MVGMALAVLATVFGPRVSPGGVAWIVGPLVIGGGGGLYAGQGQDDADARAGRAHAQPGGPGGLPGGVCQLCRYLHPAAGREKIIHEVEIYVGILIGAVTFRARWSPSASSTARSAASPLLLPGRHWLNLVALLVVIWFGREFLRAETVEQGMVPLMVMTVIALLFGIHMVAMAIGGADMPVVVSMLNSYSGWAAAATGFMLSNDLLIVTGALVGSSGAILSHIMCNAMNRNFISVIAGALAPGWRAPPRRATRCRAAGRSGAREPPPRRPSCCAMPRASSSCPATAWRWPRRSTRSTTS